MPNIKVVNIVPVPTVSIGMYCTYMYTSIKTSMFRTGLNTRRTGHIPANFRQYRPIQNFFFFLFKILSFVIFEFLLWKNGNLFALTSYYYLFS